MLGPNLSCIGVCGFITIGISLNAGTGVHTKVGVDVDNARRHKLAASVNTLCTFRYNNIGTHSNDLTFGKQNRTIFNFLTGRG